MANSRDAVTQNTQIHLLNDLQELLEKQIALAQHGCIAEVEILAERENTLIEEIRRSGILELSGAESQRQSLAKSYNKLILIITAQKDQTETQLLAIKKGKKTIEAYNSSIYV